MSNDELSNESLIKKKLTKNNVYKKEQEEILQEIMNIIGLTINDPKSIIDKDDLEQKFDKVEQLYERIKLYYASYIWSKMEHSKGRGISIIRTILKHHGYKLVYKIASKQKETCRSTTQKYFIISI